MSSMRNPNRATDISLSAVLVSLLVLAGCKANTSGNERAYLSAKARAAVAFAEAETVRRSPTVEPAQCDECRGTGTVLSGDGLARVPCPCGTRCQCKVSSTKAPAARERSRRLLYFTAKWCTNCRANNATLAALTETGWKVGDGPENHIQIVDFDVDSCLRRELRVDAVPTWVLIDGSKEIQRRHGALDPFAVGRLFDDRGE